MLFEGPCCEKVWEPLGLLVSLVSTIAQCDNYLRSAGSCSLILDFFVLALRKGIVRHRMPLIVGIQREKRINHVVDPSLALSLSHKRWRNDALSAALGLFCPHIQYSCILTEWITQLSNGELQTSTA